MSRTLFLERPSFWTEARDPEAWFRGLEALARTDELSLAGSPRMVWERALQPVLSRRAALGLFGATAVAEGALLHGVGLLAVSESDGTWRPTPEALTLLATWRGSQAQGLEGLARLVVLESPWLRLLLRRLLTADWVLTDWPRVRAGQRGLTPGESLSLARHTDPATWFVGLERSAAGRWLERTSCDAVAIWPEVLGRGRRRDDLSLTPLTAPLHLLESVGWLDATGGLRLPGAIESDLLERLSPAQLLAELSARHADIRGLVAAEPVLRELRAALGAAALDPEAFARWMDGLVSTACASGALEVLAAEPGLPRHGRGLSGDATRRLVRWVVHPGFDDAFERPQGAVAASPTSGDAP